MAKYYLLLFAVVTLALLYAFVEDPCNRLVRMEFLEKHPGYVILASDAGEGSPESVRCQITYRSPQDGQVYRDVWLYQHESKGADRGWRFTRAVETERKATPEPSW
jgi:hypothetical protein